MTANEFKAFLLQALKDQGLEFRDQGRALQTFAAQRAAHLAALVGQPGFEQAVRAEADSVALEAAKHAVRAGDATDARIAGIIQGVLSIGLRLPPAA